MFYDNFSKLCASVGKSESAVALEIGISKPTVTAWRKGGGVTNETAKKIAEYFGVSVDEILNGSNISAVLIPVDTADEELLDILQDLKENPAARMLMHAAKDADPAQVMAVAEMLMKFKGEQ